MGRGQHAKSWELRTTMSLSNLWRSLQRSSEAAERLAAICGEFTEEFDTPDFVAAQAKTAFDGGSLGNLQVYPTLFP